MSTLLAWPIMNRGKGRTYCRPSEHHPKRYVLKTQRLTHPPAGAIGEAQYDDYTIMIVVHFTRNDIEKQREWDWEPGVTGGYQRQ